MISNGLLWVTFGDSERSYGPIPFAWENGRTGPKILSKCGLRSVVSVAKTEETDRTVAKLETIFW